VSDAASRLARPAGPGGRVVLVLSLALVLLVGASTGLWTPGRGNLTGDAVVYAATGREIVERGDPTRLTLGDRLAARKPPLVFWAVAASESVLGFCDGAARLPSWVAALAALALLAVVAGRAHGRATGAVAALAAITWPVLLRSAQSCRLESTLAFLTLAAYAAWLRLDRLGPSPARALGFGALVGLAVLAKGPPGLLPAGAVTLASLATGRGRLLLRAAPLAVVGTLAVAAPWYALQILREGPAWWDQLHADWTRTTAPVRSLADAAPGYGVDVFLLAAPWLPGLALGTALAARRVRRLPARSLPEALCLGSVAVLLLSLPFVPQHYARYWAQMVPEMAWLSALWTGPLLRRLLRFAPRLRRWPAWAVAGIALGALAWPFVDHSFVPGAGAGRGRWDALAAAVRPALQAEPGLDSLPTWSGKQARGDPEDVSRAVTAAARFYLGVRLVPWDGGAAPRWLLWRHQADGPATAQALARALSLTVAASNEDFSLLHRP
jgi:4-amino-4-deoxy-L-arabinose transferase-like glycosyltransferase